MPPDQNPVEALFAAIRAGDAVAVRAALVAGASPDSEVGSGPPLGSVDQPAIAVAAWVGSIEIVELLLERGAHIDATCTEWHTYPFNDDPTPFPADSALSLAAGAGHLEVVELLLARGARVTPGDPLIQAVRAGRRDIAGRLLGAGASPGAADGDLHTPIHYAAAAGDLDLVIWLHQQGGRFARAIDLDGALERAREQGHQAVVDWLTGVRRRDLLDRQLSFWEIVAGDPGELLVEVLHVLHGTRPAWGEITSEHSRTEPSGLEPRRVIEEQVRRLGAWEVGRTVTRHYDPPVVAAGNLRRTSVRYDVRGGIHLLLELEDARDGWPDQVFWLGLSGDLDAADEKIRASSLGRSRRWLGDADSAHALRQRLGS